jgi:hypothetical protein
VCLLTRQPSSMCPGVCFFTGRNVLSFKDCGGGGIRQTQAPTFLASRQRTAAVRARYSVLSTPVQEMTNCKELNAWKLTVPHLVRILPAFNGTRSFTAAFT